MSQLFARRPGSRLDSPNVKLVLVGQTSNFFTEQTQRLRTQPKTYLKYRKKVEAELNSRFRLILKDNPEQAEALRFSTHEMRTKLGKDTTLLKALVLIFSVGVRRPTPGNGFNISFSPRYPMIGRNRVSLTESWKHHPSGYLSLAVANFPNHCSEFAELYPVGLKSNDHDCSAPRPKCTGWPRFSAANIGACCINVQPRL